MSNRVDARRRDVAFSVLGGPTTVVDLDESGILDVLAVAPHGEWIVPTWL